MSLSNLMDSAAVTLRPLEISDVSAALKWLMDDDVSRFCPWHAFTDKKHAIRYFVKNQLLHPWHKAICVSDNVVGWICVTLLEDKDDKCRAEIGYVVASEAKGVATAAAALKMAAKQVFEECKNVDRVEAKVDVDNTTSQDAVEKAGFTKEAILRKYSLLKGKSRDIIIFSLLATEIGFAH